MKRIEAVEYDANTEITAMETFTDVREAIKWCEARRGDTLRLGDTKFGFQLITEAENNEWEQRSGEMPAKWYEIHGLTEEGEVDYLEDADFEVAFAHKA